MNLLRIFCFMGIHFGKRNFELSKVGPSGKFEQKCIYCGKTIKSRFELVRVGIVLAIVFIALYFYIPSNFKLDELTSLGKTSTPTATSVPKLFMTVNTNNVNVRPSPDTNHVAIGKLLNGEVVEVTDKVKSADKEWCEIAYNNINGFVVCSFLSEK